MIRIDLNSDVGESFSRWTLGDDAALLAIVSSANIACGFHAGDPRGIRSTLELAATNGVTVGPMSGTATWRGSAVATSMWLRTS